MSAQSKQKILIIDDAPLETIVLSKILLPFYDVRIASNGQIGLDLIEKFDFDLIILDIIMPEISGFEVLARLKSCDKTKDIPVIIITGLDSSADTKKGIELGADEYITKPFEEHIITLKVKINIMNGQ